MAKVLELQFQAENAKNFTITVEEPSPTLTEEQIFERMATVIASNIFQVEGSPLVKIKGARIVDRHVTEFKKA